MECICTISIEGINCQFAAEDAVHCLGVYTKCGFRKPVSNESETNEEKYVRSERWYEKYYR